MRNRRGQVAVYLVLVLVAITVLVMMNVSVFLSVRSKNRMMNAVDAAAIAAARHQGALLNEIGRMNVEHLRYLIVPEDADWRPEDMSRMRELAMFGPLEAIGEANRVAKSWGFEEPSANDELVRNFRSHLNEIAERYCNNPDMYPEFRAGQWADYAAKFQEKLNEGMVVAPGYMELADGWSQEPLLNGAFYDSIDSRDWYWFKFEDRSRYFDMDSKSFPRPEMCEPQLQENSEVFSLHVTFKTWMESEWAEGWVEGVGFSEKWTNFVCQVTGCDREQLARSNAADPDALWAFYDGYWGRWSKTFNPDNIPIAGSVKPEYDVAGCVASCLMIGDVVRLTGEKTQSRSMLVSAEAKPLGTVVDTNGGVSPVTAFGSFVSPSRRGEQIFTTAQLVPMYSVPRSPRVSMDPAWYVHVKEHLPAYFAVGPQANGCRYCHQLVLWEDSSFRTAAYNWFMTHDYILNNGAGHQGGGYGWAH